jgi:DNA-binding transcriptional LysR family regulator
VCATRVKGLSGEFIRFEPMVWAATPSARGIWSERPLPIAVFLPGSVARENAIRSLERAKIPYRTSYESPSLMGLLSMVEAGLAVAPLARCAVPAHLTLLGQAQGLPEIDPLEVILARSTKSKRPPCDFLAEKIMSELRR